MPGRRLDVEDGEAVGGQHLDHRDQGQVGIVLVIGRIELVLADRVQVQQVILNLLRNAIEAMEGAERRELTVSIERAPAEMALVSVTDTGPGISPEITDRLFQPFITTKAEGMGVGLSISRSIIEAHGGRLWVETGPTGATFRFTLKAVDRKDLEDE